jgi:hypothetical protein
MVYMCIYYIIKIVFFFWWYWGLNSGPHTCCILLYHLSHISSLFLLWLFFLHLFSCWPGQWSSYLHFLCCRDDRFLLVEMSSCEFFVPWLTSNFSPSSLCLPSSWNYRYVLLRSAVWYFEKLPYHFSHQWLCSFTFPLCTEVSSFFTLTNTFLCMCVCLYVCVCLNNSPSQWVLSGYFSGVTLFPSFCYFPNTSLL